MTIHLNHKLPNKKIEMLRHNRRTSDLINTRTLGPVEPVIDQALRKTTLTPSRLMSIIKNNIMSKTVLISKGYMVTKYNFTIAKMNVSKIRYLSKNIFKDIMISKTYLKLSSTFCKAMKWKKVLRLETTANES